MQRGNDEDIYRRVVQGISKICGSTARATGSDNDFSASYVQIACDSELAGWQALNAFPSNQAATNNGKGQRHFSLANHIGSALREDNALARLILETHTGRFSGWNSCGHKFLFSLALCAFPGSADEFFTSLCFGPDHSFFAF